MTKRNFEKELCHYIYNDPEYGEDIENIDYRSLICIITELCDRIEQLEKDNELLKSYAIEWKDRDEYVEDPWNLQPRQPMQPVKKPQL